MTPGGSPRRSAGSRTIGLVASVVLLGLVAACSSPADPATEATASSGPSTTTTTPPAPTTAPAPPYEVGPAGTFEVLTATGTLVDEPRNRTVSYTVRAPAGVSGAAPVIVVSHGGFGSPRGNLSGAWLSEVLASGGFVVVNPAHDETTPKQNLLERPLDVTFVLDQVASGGIALPEGFVGTPDVERAGHAGHSFGAYTAHAVAGATYRDRTYRDDRIVAIAPISPQGPDQFGAFVDGPGATTWSTVTIPAFDLIGGDEIDGNVVGSLQRTGWRLAPFDNYPGTADTFRVIIAGQDHLDMWNRGQPDVQRFIATSILDFMRRYIAGDTTVDACTIAALPAGGGGAVEATLERRPATGGSSSIATCP